MATHSERPVNLADVVRRQARLRPTAPALSFADRTQTYAELDARSSQVANALLNRGLQAGDRVAILARNLPLFFELAFAAGKANLQMVGLNWRLAAAEIEGIVRDAAPALVIVADEFQDSLNDKVRALPATDIISVAAFEKVVDGASESDPTSSSTPAQVVCVLYTSGTTGQPKGVQLTHENMGYSGWISEHAYGVTAASVNLVAMPLFHVGGLGYGLSAFMHGGHTILLQAPDAGEIITAIDAYQVTHAFFVPAVIQTIVSHEMLAGANLSSLELLVYGASPISDALLRAALQALDCRFVQAYGMTETAGSVVILDAAEHDPESPHAGRLRACGKALPWIELRIVDPAAGTDVAQGEVGEIWTRSRQNTPGYRNKPEETAAAILTDGWLRTGDAAYQDEDGFIYLFDRYKDMIVSGAENIYPAEVENALYDHADVAEVAVIGVPHERWGETVMAMVVRAPEATVEAQELIEFSRTRLAKYKCPTSIEFVTELPRNASGKLLKTELRAPYWQHQQRAIS
jgi:acyl-CoA synthetase (AMP-forming)/AMP-acid ligase II